MSKVLYLRDQPHPVKHVTFDPSGTIIAASCSDGTVYLYSLSSEQPRLIKKLDGLIKKLDNEAEASSRVVWHPSGLGFAAPDSSRSEFCHLFVKCLSNSL